MFRSFLGHREFHHRRGVKKASQLPFIILTKKDKIPNRKLNIKHKKEGIEMLNAVRRRKETKNNYEILANRIKHLKAAERKENSKIRKIQSQIEKCNLVRKVRSEYLNIRSEIQEKERKEQDEKYKQAQSYKKAIQESIKQKRLDLITKNRKIMEEILRDQDLHKMKKKKKLPLDKNKSEYRNRIAREKLEANSYNRKLQDLERLENDMIEKLENTQVNRKELMSEFHIQTSGSYVNPNGEGLM